MARGQEFIPLWDSEMPNSRGIPVTDSVENGRWRRVAVPGYFHFRPSAEENKGAAVVICTPGGYGHHTYDIAGFQLAKWFNTMGVSAFVLINRLPHSPDLVDRSTGPLVDAQRMMRIVRANAGAWGIDPERVGAMGSSAGGHLAATLATWGQDLAWADDRYGEISAVPDFLILVSPVITMEAEFTHAGSVRNLLGEHPSVEMIDRFSCEKHVGASTPPVFMVHADDDPAVSSWNSVLFYSALKRSGVPASLHIFPYGGHAIALRNNPGSTQQWTALCEAWLHEMKFIP
jgi:acetyl esterase/lipase